MVHLINDALVSSEKRNEPRYEKTGLRSFRPGQTKPVCIAIDDGWRLEISDLDRRGIVQTM